MNLKVTQVRKIQVKFLQSLPVSLLQYSKDAAMSFIMPIKGWKAVTSCFDPLPLVTEIIFLSPAQDLDLPVLCLLCSVWPVPFLGRIHTFQNCAGFSVPLQ